jgi:hypothetical protein
MTAIAKTACKAQPSPRPVSSLAVVTIFSLVGLVLSLILVHYGFDPAIDVILGCAQCKSGDRSAARHSENSGRTESWLALEGRGVGAARFCDYRDVSRHTEQKRGSRAFRW